MLGGGEDSSVGYSPTKAVSATLYTRAELESAVDAGLKWQRECVRLERVVEALEQRVAAHQAPLPKAETAEYDEQLGLCFSVLLYD